MYNVDNFLQSTCCKIYVNLKYMSLFFSGALDTNTIHIVPKNRINESVVKKAPMKVLNQPFETTFRLQVRDRLLVGIKLLKSEDICIG